MQLDHEVVAFGDKLFITLKMDRESPVWRGFFRVSPSALVRQDLASQLATVEGWLSVAEPHPILVEHKDKLGAAVARAHAARRRQAALATRRGDLWQTRETLAGYLTTERDALHDELSAIARQHGFSRQWANTFFRVGKRSRKTEPAPSPTDVPVT